MGRLGLPLHLLSWVKSFLNLRRLRLSFNGENEEFNKVETGIPQGSPVSPILFLIYIRELFPSTAVKFLSYIDDISLSTSSTSWKKNIKILERESAKLYELGALNAVEFDLKKTELIHFSNSKETKKFPLLLPDGNKVEPKSLVRWLGIYFDPGLTFKEHTSIRISQARSAFLRLSRLANIERGLSPHAIQQLYLACITTAGDYGSQVYWKNQSRIKRQMQVL